MENPSREAPAMDLPSARQLDTRIISEICLNDFVYFSENKNDGAIILNYVNFYGEAKQTFKTPDHISKYKRGLSLKEGYYGQIWRNAWVPGLDKWEERGKDFRVCQNIGRGILFTGTDIWKDYSVSSKIILQSLSSGGLASRVQGLKRYYTFELNKNNKITIGKMFYNFKYFV